MSGEARVLQSELPVNLPVIEKQLVLEQKTAANEQAIVLPRTDSLKMEDRFVRLKRNLRKRSASIL